MRWHWIRSDWINSCEAVWFAEVCLAVVYEIENQKMALKDCLNCAIIWAKLPFTCPFWSREKVLNGLMSLLLSPVSVQTPSAIKSPSQWYWKLVPVSAVLQNFSFTSTTSHLLPSYPCMQLPHAAPPLPPASVRLPTSRPKLRIPKNLMIWNRFTGRVVRTEPHQDHLNSTSYKRSACFLLSLIWKSSSDPHC